ncbi:MAG: ATP-binding cassette domain-containing protein [Actinobacteria bacterium]|nr:ATP-binding cassette domain-containing protein [Actinomycetota bacterium]
MKVFPRGGVVAVEDISFDVRQGEFISLVGPSGCGKSTILRLVAGLIGKSSGSLHVHGSEVLGPRQDLAMMFQRPILLPWKTAIENVTLPVRIKGRVDEVTLKEARGLLGFLGLEQFHHAYPQHLSGGMQQRVALARLLITGNELLLMDEPFAALDEFTRERLTLELLRIQSRINATVMFVTHSIIEAVFLADRVLVMTPLPGRLAGIVEVPLERPRTIDLMRTPEFNDLVFKVRGMLGEHA